MGTLLDNYKGLASPESLELIRKLADHFQGSSILHVYSGRLPMGIKGMLAHLSRLFADVGLRHWSTVLVGTEDLFDVVRFAEQDLSEGSLERPPDALRDSYVEMMKEKSRRSYLTANLVVVHGLQPLGLIEHRPDDRPWIWRCHSDVSNTAPAFWPFAHPFAARYQGALFSHEEFMPKLEIPTFVFSPSADPFSEANLPMTRREIEGTLRALDVPSDRPLVLQFLSAGTAAEAFEAIRTWKGVANSGRAVLVLIQLGAQAIVQEAAFLPSPSPSFVDEGIRFVSLSISDSERKLCALGWAAIAAIDSSASRWPNLYLLDILWKAKPALVAEGSRSARFVPQEAGGRFKSPAELAWRLGELLQDEERARRMGQAGRTAVLERFLASRHLLDYLKLLLYFEGSPSMAP